MITFASIEQDIVEFHCIPFLCQRSQSDATLIIVSEFHFELFLLRRNEDSLEEENKNMRTKRMQKSSLNPEKGKQT
jgi:hypothetical protein